MMNLSPPHIVRILICRAFFLLSSLIFFSSSVSAQSSSYRQVERLAAFAKALGYVRYFYPSQNIRTIDWNQFALRGSEVVWACKSEDELASRLTELFNAIGKDIQVDKTSKIDSMTLPQLSCQPSEMMFWQHKGAGFHGLSPYQSELIGSRSAGLINAMGLKQPIGAKAHDSLNVQINLQAQKTFFAGQIQLYCYSVGGELIKKVDFIPTKARPSGRTFQARLAGFGDKVILGIDFNLSGVEDLKIQSVLVNSSNNSNKSIDTLFHFDFTESNETTLNKTFDFKTAGSIFSLVLDRFSSRPVLRLENKSIDETNFLFPAKIDLNKSILKKAISSELSLTFPVVNCASLANRGSSDRPDIRKIPRHKIETRSLLYVSNIITAWNAIRFFFPYPEKINDIWEQELEKAIQAALSAISDTEFTMLFREMLLPLQDGHATIFERRPQPVVQLPFKMEEINQRSFVRQILDSSITVLKLGDEILAIGGQAVTNLIAKNEALISGSSQWKNFNAVQDATYGAVEKQVAIKCARGNRNFTVHLDRTMPIGVSNDLKKMQHMQGGIYYVNLSILSSDELADSIDKLRSASTIIFDLRNRPKVDPSFLEYIMHYDDTANGWMRIPCLTGGDSLKASVFATAEWLLKAKKEPLTAKCIFLTDASAISYSESILSMIKHYQLGTIISNSNTAGANGDVCAMELNGHFVFYWTGMRVGNLDQMESFGVGIKPDIIVHPSLSDFVNGEDYLLQRAIRLCRPINRE